MISIPVVRGPEGAATCRKHVLHVSPQGEHSSHVPRVQGIRGRRIVIDALAKAVPGFLVRIPGDVQGVVGVEQRRMPSVWRWIARVCRLRQRTRHARIPVSRALGVEENGPVEGSVVAVVLGVSNGVSILQRAMGAILATVLPVQGGVRAIVTGRRARVLVWMLLVWFLAL